MCPRTRFAQRRVGSPLHDLTPNVFAGFCFARFDTPEDPLLREAADFALGSQRLPDSRVGDRHQYLQGRTGLGAQGIGNSFRKLGDPKSSRCSFQKNRHVS